MHRPAQEPLSQLWWAAARQASTDLSGGDNRELQERSRLRIHEHLLRLGLIAQLAPRGWFNYEGSCDYLAHIRTHWSVPTSPYRFDQRLQMLFNTGLSQPSKRAREIVAPHIGVVPYLGTGLFESQDIEAQVDFSEVNDWFWNEGLVSAAEASPIRPRTRVWKKCLIDIEGQAGDVKDVHVHDPDVRIGDYLASMFWIMLDRLASKSEWDDTWPTMVLKNNLSGLTDDPFDLQEARFRLALIGLGRQTGPIPTALTDIREVIRLGRPVTTSGSKPKIAEGPDVEFKSSLEWNTRTRERSPDLKKGVLKTIAAYLNTEGGQLFIGIDDTGKAIGIGHDLAQLDSKKPRDVYEGKIREYLKNHIDPCPYGAVSVSFPEVEGVQVCLIEVSPQEGVAYLVWKGADGRPTEEIFVRDGNRTVSLSGRARDRFVLARFHGADSLEIF